MAPIIASKSQPSGRGVAYAIDPSRFAEWQKGVVDGHLEVPGTPRVGARCLTTRRIGFANRPTIAVGFLRS